MFFVFFWVVFKKSVKSAVPDDGNPPGALVWTKLSEWYRFGVGDEKSNFHFCLYCRRKELIPSVRKPREKLCASAFHHSKTQKKVTKSGRLRRPLCVRVFPVLEGWNALAHSFSPGFRTLAIVLSDNSSMTSINKRLVQEARLIDDGALFYFW